MTTRIVSVLLLAVLATGCSRKPSSPVQPVTKVIVAAPVDGATNVRLDAAVTLDFATAVDRDAVENGVHLIAEPDMFSGCPDTTMGSHGTMESVMDDANMLRHMEAVHAMAGSYSWNAAGTACTFQPDTLMRAQTRYMVHLSSAMLERMSRNGVNMMGGRMNTAGDMLLHFMTTTADGHAGHH